MRGASRRNGVEQVLLFTRLMMRMARLRERAAYNWLPVLWMKRYERESAGEG